MSSRANWRGSAAERNGGSLVCVHRCLQHSRRECVHTRTHWVGGTSIINPCADSPSQAYGLWHGWDTCGRNCMQTLRIGRSDAPPPPEATSLGSVASVQETGGRTESGCCSRFGGGGHPWRDLKRLANPVAVFFSSDQGSQGVGQPRSRGVKERGAQRDAPQGVVEGCCLDSGLHQV